jgi:hypothetical protein
MDKMIEDIKKKIGFPGMEKLASALSFPHNNREVASQFDLTLMQTVFLNNNIRNLWCAILKERDRYEKANIFYLHTTNCAAITERYHKESA